MKEYKKPSEDELKKILDETEFNVTQRNATERPFSSPHNNNFKDGIYVDIVTGEPLFSSKDKYNAAAAGRLLLKLSRMMPSMKLLIQVLEWLEQKCEAGLEIHI